MNRFPAITAMPDRIALQTDAGTEILPGACSVRVGDAVVQFLQDSVTLTAGTTAVREIRLRWNAPLPEGCRFLGDAWERGYGDLEWRGFVPERVMPWYFLVCREGCTAGYGVKVNPDALCYFCADPKGITLVMDVRCGGAGVFLKGKTITCAQICCGEYDQISPYTAACRFVKQLADGCVLPSAPVYGFNNWYYAYGNSSREEILQNAAHLASLTKGLDNRPFMVIDDGWQPARKAGYIGGPWRSGNEKFSDMQALAEEMRAMELQPGIWFRPLQNTDPAIPAAWRQQGHPDLLDPTLPAVLDFIGQDVKTMVQWGYRLIKHDFSTYDLVGQWGPAMGGHVSAREGIAFADRTQTTAMAMKSLYRAIHEAAGGKALILGCNCVGHLGVGAMEINRTGDDVSGMQWERTRQRGVNTLAFRMPQHNVFFSADADCVGITSQIDWQKNKQWMELLAYSGTPLFVSVASDTLNREQNSFVASMLAAASQPQPPAEPLDWMSTTCPALWRIGEEARRFDWYEAAGIADVKI